MNIEIHKLNLGSNDWIEEIVDFSRIPAKEDILTFDNSIFYEVKKVIYTPNSCEISAKIYITEIKFEENNKISNESHEKKYSSAELLLDTVQNQYQQEETKINSIHSRTGIFIAFVGAIIIYLPTIIKIQSITNDDFIMIFKSLKIIFSYVSFLGAIIFNFISIYYFIKALSPKSYEKINIQCFNKELCYISKEQNAANLMEKYSEIIRTNEQTFQRNVNYYTKAIKFLVAALMSIITNYICYLIL